MKSFRFIIILFVFLQSGCAFNSPFIPIRDEGGRISQYGLSILPPAGGEWMLMKQSPYGGAVFVKSINRSEHTWSCQFMLIQNNFQADSPQKYLNYLKAEKDKDNNPNRFEVLVNDFLLDDRYGDFTVKYLIKAKDNNPVTESGNPLILKAFGYMFQYPGDDKYTVEIGCSERSSSDEFTSSIMVIGNKFIDDLIIEQ